MQTRNLFAVLFLFGSIGCQRPAAYPTTLNQAEVGAGTADAHAAAPSDRNTSTTLGDGTSGMYTGGMGSYGGKATWGQSAVEASPPPAPTPPPQAAAEPPPEPPKADPAKAEPPKAAEPQEAEPEKPVPAAKPAKGAKPKKGGKPVKPKKKKK